MSPLLPPCRVLWAAALLCASPALGLAAEFDREALYRHLRKTFSAPPTLRLELKGLKASPIAGFSYGTLEIGEGAQAQSQVVHVSDDGRFYVLSPAYALAPGAVPGLRGPVGNSGQEPPVQLSKDGRHFLYGAPQDMRVDPDAVNRGKIKLTRPPDWGNPKAEVAVVEFSDLQCPHCKRAHEMLAELLAPYAERVRLYFKHHPLTGIHPWAYDAALAAACASRLKPDSARALQGSFFAEQASIQKEQVRAKALEFARKAGLDETAFASCYDRQESKPLVEEDIAQARALELPGTPVVFIHGRRAPHHQPEAFKAILDEILK